MKIDDIIVEGPVWDYTKHKAKQIGKNLATKAMTAVPGSVGAMATGKLDTVKVANQLKKEFMVFLGRTGGKPNTDNLKDFFLKKGFSSDIVSSAVGESVFTERDLSKIDVDNIILKLAKSAASIKAPTVNPSSPSVPRNASSKPGILNKAVNAIKKGFTKTVSPADATPAPSANTVSPATPAKQQTPTAGIDTYLNSWAKSIKTAGSTQEKMSLAKEMIKFLSDRKGSPEAKAGATAAISVIKRLGDPKLAKIAQGLRTFQMERANYAIANFILEEIGLTWKDLGMRIVFTESTTTHVTIAYR